MAKLEGWSPKTRSEQRRIHERVPQHVADADEFFSFTTFEYAGVQLTTRQKLLDRFYWHADTSGGNKPWLAMRLDPHEVPGHPVERHQWYWMHRGDFYAVVELSYYGVSRVHRCRLYYRQSGGAVLWLASCQLGPHYFYSAEKMAIAYYEVIEQKLWHMAEYEREKVVAM